MSEISILDLQNLRHLIGGYETTHCKMTDYAKQAEDPEVKKLFQDAADSENIAQLIQVSEFRYHLPDGFILRFSFADQLGIFVLHHLSKLTFCLDDIRRVRELCKH